MYRTIMIVLVFGLHASLFGVQTMDAQIAALQHASPAKRVELMNAIKIQLSQMNAKERGAAINRLRHKKDVPMPLQHQQQMGNMENMGRHENMNQRQGMDQYHHEHPQGGSPPTQMPSMPQQPNHDVHHDSGR